MSFATAYGMKKRMKKGKAAEECMAEGGEVDQDQANPFKQMSDKIAGKEPEEDQPKAFADGGEVKGSYQTADRALDMVGKIMDRHYSSGGMVANDVGVAEADKLPAEYDDLVLRDDLEDTSGPGNEIGDETLDQEDADVVSKIMNYRKKKDRMPRPA